MDQKLSCVPECSVKHGAVARVSTPASRRSAEPYGSNSIACHKQQVLCRLGRVSDLEQGSQESEVQPETQRLQARKRAQEKKSRTPSWPTVSGSSADDVTRTWHGQTLALSAATLLATRSCSTYRSRFCQSMFTNLSLCLRR